MGPDLPEPCIIIFCSSRVYADRMEFTICKSNFITDIRQHFKYDYDVIFETREHQFQCEAFAMKMTVKFLQ